MVLGLGGERKHLPGPTMVITWTGSLFQRTCRPAVGTLFTAVEMSSITGCVWNQNKQLCIALPFSYVTDLVFKCFMILFLKLF